MADDPLKTILDQALQLLSSRQAQTKYQARHAVSTNSDPNGPWFLPCSLSYCTLCDPNAAGRGSAKSAVAT